MIPKFGSGTVSWSVSFVVCRGQYFVIIFVQNSLSFVEYVFTGSTAERQ